MKYLIKSSFILILLIAVFNIGVSEAFAEEAKTPETNTIEIVDAVPLQCSMQIITYLTATLESKVPTGFDLLANAETSPECPFKVIETRTGVFFFYHDCTVVYYPKEQ